MVIKNATEKELNDMGISQQQENTTYFYDKAYNLCDEKKAVAKMVKIPAETNESHSTIYYIKHGRGQLFDPYGMDMYKIKAFDFQFKKVDSEIFNSYCKYLSTRREVYLISARRSFINKGY